MVHNDGWWQGEIVEISSQNLISLVEKGRKDKRQYSVIQS